jgi:hypothetical protein
MGQWYFRSGRLTTRNNKPWTVWKAYSPNEHWKRCLVVKDEPAPFLDAYTTLPLSHHEAQAVAAQTINYKALVIPVSAKSSVAWALDITGEATKESLHPAFLAPDQRYTPKTRWHKNSLSKQLQQSGFHQAQTVHELDPDKTNYRLERQRGLEMAVLWPVTQSKLKAWAQDPKLNELLPLWEWYSSPLGNQSKAEEALKEELWPLIKSARLTGITDARITPYQIPDGPHHKAEHRIRVRGYSHAVHRLHEELLYKPPKTMLFDERLPPSPPRPGAETPQQDPLGTYSRQFIMDAAFPFGTPVDLDKPLWEQTSLFNPSRGAAQKPSEPLRTLALFTSANVLDEHLFVIDHEAVRWHPGVPSGIIADTFIGNSNYQLVLSTVAQKEGVAGKAKVVPVDGEVGLAAAMAAVDPPVRSSHNLAYDRGRERAIRRLVRADEQELFVRRLDRYRRESGKPSLSQEEVQALWTDWSDRVGERESKGVGRTRDILPFSGVEWCTYEAVRSRGGPLFAQMGVEGLTGERKPLDYERQADNYRLGRYQENWDYVANDGRVELPLARDEYLVLAAECLEWGVDLDRVSSRSPGRLAMDARDREQFLRWAFNPKASFSSFEALERSRGDPTSLGSYVSEALRVRQGPFFGRFYVGFPEGAINAFSSAHDSPLLMQHPYLRMLWQRRERFSALLSRVMLPFAVAGALEEPVSRIADWQRSKGKKLGTMHSVSEMYPESSTAAVEASEDYRAERALQARLRWATPGGTSIDSPQGPLKAPHHRLTYANALAQSLSQLPAPLAATPCGVVSDKPDGLFLYSKEPLWGFVLGRGRAVLLAGDVPLALGTRKKIDDRIYGLLREAARQGPTDELIAGARRAPKKGLGPEKDWLQAAKALELAQQTRLPA